MFGAAAGVLTPHCCYSLQSTDVCPSVTTFLHYYYSYYSHDAHLPATALLRHHHACTVVVSYYDEHQTGDVMLHSCVHLHDAKKKKEEEEEVSSSSPP